MTVIIQKLWNQISGKFHADELLRELALLQDAPITDHWTFTLPGVMITGTLIIFIIGLCCWKKCSQMPIMSQPMAYYAPSAPPALMVFNMNKELV